MGVALLAPVPSLHLKSALATCAQRGKVAFGSMKTDVFDKLRNDFGLNVPVYIYASVHHGRTGEKYEVSGKASLRGNLCNVQRANDQGKHPDSIYRPDRTFEPEKRGLEIWWWFWEVSDLVVLPHEDCISLTKFTALDKPKPLPFGFVPQGPMIVKGAFIP